MKSISIFFKTIFLILFFFSSYSLANTINKIEITGNDRISDETIKLFISVEINDEINDNKLRNYTKQIFLKI